MANEFTGRVALVTGAGRGIGRAIAVALASAGARVALVARSRDQLDRTAELVADAGGTSDVIEADLGDLGAIPSVVGQALDAFGTVDILVNNAATVAPLVHTS